MKQHSGAWSRGATETARKKATTPQVREAVVKYRRPRAAPTTTRGIVRPEEAAAFVRKLIDGDVREHFVVLHLDARHRVCSYQIVSVGTSTSALVHPREVFQAAVVVGAATILVAHNHPSGDTTPSEEDREITKRLVVAGDILGIKVLDSIVVTETDFHSIIRGEDR